MDQIGGVKSSWRTIYTYNPSIYLYDMRYNDWPYDQLNIDFSMQIGNKLLAIEPIWSFTLIKGWYGVTYNVGKYTADDQIIYKDATADPPPFVDGEEFLYKRGSGRVGQNRLGANLMLGDEVQIGAGVWWQKQKIEFYKSSAYNRYWHSRGFSLPGADAYVTYDEDVHVNEPTMQLVYYNRVIFPLIFRYRNGVFSSHITFIFQKPFQFLAGSGIYF